MNIDNKEKCDCGKMAVWYYMPSTDSNNFNPYSCDDCISTPESQPCSCNYNYTKGEFAEELPKGVEGKDWRWVTHPGSEHMGQITKEEGIFINLDEKGRPYPCCEYDYDEEGYDIEPDPTLLAEFDDFLKK